MEKQIFRLITLPEAIEFLDSLPDNVREKILYNIRKVCAGVKDIRLFKKLGSTPIWSLELSGWELHIVCWRFGIRMVRLL